MEMNELLQGIIDKYDSVVKVVDEDAKGVKDRAYGGYIRAKKGALQEHITERLAHIAWAHIGGTIDRISINSSKIKIPISQDYVEQIKDKDVAKYIKDNIVKFMYRLSVDKHVFIDGEFVIAIECKAYTENAMIKRILVDFDLLKKRYPKLLCYLFQMESQLGGDYSKLETPVYGSPSTHTLQSYFPFDLNIITLLEGERDVDRPIHKYYKPLKMSALQNAVNILADGMKRFL